MKNKILIFLCPLLFFSLDGLELKRVVLSSDDNPTYLEFWPIVAPLWSEMGLTPTLALIADEECEIDRSLGDVIRFDPIPGVPIALQSQAVRLLLPALFPEEGCLISDMDMLPISKAYFFGGAKECPDNTFLVYRDKGIDPIAKQYPMCYVAAKGRVFSSLFEIETKDQINSIIKKWNDLNLGWFSDQLILYNEVNEWEKEGGSVLRLGHGVGPRLDRLYWNVAEDTSLNANHYIDCHCPRPYSAYSDSIDKVVLAIKKSWK